MSLMFLTEIFQRAYGDFTRAQKCIFVNETPEITLARHV